MSSACRPCTAASTNPRNGLYRAACLECRARSIANSQVFHDARQAKDITTAYQAVLEQAFGMDWEAGHERVKAWHKAIRHGVSAGPAMNKGA